MVKTLKLLPALGIALVLAACDTDAERAVGGAVIGGVIADQTGGDPAVGAAIGATAGVFCNDAGVCQ